MWEKWRRDAASDAETPKMSLGEIDSTGRDLSSAREAVDVHRGSVNVGPLCSPVARYAP